MSRVLKSAVRVPTQGEAFLRNGSVKVSELIFGPSLWALDGQPMVRIEVLTSKGNYASGGIEVLENDFIELCRRVVAMADEEVDEVAQDFLLNKAIEEDPLNTLFAEDEEVQ